MPRKKNIYTNEFPYHVYARSNNQEWFYLPLDQVWDIFVSEINRVVTDYKVSVHAFVLMSNHYHMLVTAHEHHPLGEVMCELQKSVSRRINRLSERSNHVFGGPYKAALIRHEVHFLEIYKYIYRNPVKAGIVCRVEQYFYSTFFNNKIILTPPSEEIKKEFPVDTLTWLNTPSDKEREECIKRGLKKTEFRISAFRNY